MVRVVKEESLAMPDQVTFAAQRRELMKKKVNRLRRQGVIPGNIYGRNRASVPVQVNAHDFERFLATHAATTVLRLAVDGTSETAVVRHVQHNPRNGAIEHVDFLHIEMSEPIRVRVPIRLEGDAPALKVTDGIMLQLLDTVEVETLPGDLTDAIGLDVSDMEDLKATHYVRDLKVPSRVTVLTDPDEPVAKIEPPRIQAELAAAAAAAAPAEEAPTAEAETPVEAGAETEAGTGEESS